MPTAADVAIKAGFAQRGPNGTLLYTSPPVGGATAIQRSIDSSSSEDAVQRALAIEANLVAAVANRELADHAAAVGALRRALDLAAPEGYRRAFVEAGAPVRQLLADHLHWDNTHHPLVGALLERLRSAEPAGPAALVVPLSEREQVVLRYLSSRLSAGEIADELYVSLNTVKTHIKSIYRKLDTNRRSDAVKRARQLQLL